MASEASARRARRVRAEKPALSARGIAGVEQLSAKRGKDSSLQLSMRGLDWSVPLGNWARDVFTRQGPRLGKDLEGQVASEREWKSFYAELLLELLPVNALVAFAGEDWRQGSMYTDFGARFYAFAASRDAVVRAIAESAGEPLSALACSFEEHQFHRDYWRVELGTGRVRLTAHAGYGDYGDQAHVDLRAHPLGPGGERTLLVACMYSGKAGGELCDALVPGAR